jgi:hypothetical protein
MNDDPKRYFRAISPAADTATALARLLRDMLGRDQYYHSAGGLGFGYTYTDQAFRIIVDWQSLRRLQVIAPDHPTVARMVQPFERRRNLDAELADTLRDLQQCRAADQATPPRMPH